MKNSYTLCDNHAWAGLGDCPDCESAFGQDWASGGKTALQEREHENSFVTDAAIKDTGFTGNSAKTQIPYKLNGDASTVVSTEVFWKPVNKDTPRNVKVLAIARHRSGVAQMAELKFDETWLTHWHPLPKFKS